MCIIVFKPKKHAMPTSEFMANCFANNPHGAGIMFRDVADVHIRKGFMTLESLVEAIADIEKEYPLKARDVAIHFRISTTGSTVPQNTHPFPLSNHVRDLKALTFTCGRAIAHNGILREYATFHNKKSDMSDTMYFAKMLTGVNERFVKTLLGKHAVGSRFVYMSKTKSILVGMNKITTGANKGLFASNDSYEETINIYDTVMLAAEPHGGRFYYGGAYDDAYTYPAKTSTRARSKSPSFVNAGTPLEDGPSLVNRNFSTSNPIYNAWVGDRSIKGTFIDYCDSLDASLAAAWEEEYKPKPATNGEKAMSLYSLWTVTPTSMPYLQFVDWARIVYETFDVPQRASPISRVRGRNNPAYVAWWNTSMDGPSFERYCELEEDRLFDAIMNTDYVQLKAPTTPVETTKKATREAIYSERATELENLSRWME